MEIVIFIVLLGLLFDYTNGFHDAANVASTPIATGALKPMAAIILAAVLNFLGATQISGVAETIAKGIVEIEQTTQLVVLCATVGAIFWNFFTWYLAIPSSSSYALVGGLIGSSLAHSGMASIHWMKIIGKILVPMVISPLAGFIIAALFMKLIFKCSKNTHSETTSSLFKNLQIASASFVALSHGLNDAQKSMGIITLGLYSAGIITSTHIPLWVIAACALVMGIGTATGGLRIIKTMGFGITKIHPDQGFAAETSSSIVILTASFLGMPISSTHVIAGGITGVGVAKGWDLVSWAVPKRLILALFFTLPGAAFVGAVSYFLLHFIIS